MGFSIETAAGCAWLVASVMEWFSIVTAANGCWLMLAASLFKTFAVSATKGHSLRSFWVASAVQTED